MSHENHEDRVSRFLGTMAHAFTQPMSEVEAFRRLTGKGVGQPTFIDDSFAISSHPDPALVDVAEVQPLVFIDRDNRKSEVVIQAASSLLDHGRFHYRVDRVLSRYDESECGEPRYPDSDELIAAGVDVVSLAIAVEDGLTPATLGKAYHAGLDLRAFADAAARGLNVKAFVKAFNGRALSVSELADTLASTEISTVNDCLEMIAERVAEHAAYPDLTDRVLHRLGEC